MGSSFCTCCTHNDDDDDQENDADEHSSLLRNPVINSPNSIPHTSTTWTQPIQNHDELDSIIHRTAADIIDIVGPAVEPREYVERCHRYSARLNQSLSHRQSLIPVHAIPRGVRSPQVLFAPLPPHSDVQLVSAAAENISTAMSSMNVQQHIELVVPFTVS